MGTRYENPVKVDNKIVVLIGVRVTQALMAAMQLMMVKDKLTVGQAWCKIMPSVVPTKNKGMINPPLQPEVTVTAIAMIFTNKMSTSVCKENPVPNN